MLHKGHIGPFSWWLDSGGLWWVRVGAVVLIVKDTRLVSLLFSERMGYVHRIQVGSFSFRLKVG